MVCLLHLSWSFLSFRLRVLLPWKICKTVLFNTTRCCRLQDALDVWSPLRTRWPLCPTSWDGSSLTVTYLWLTGTKCLWQPMEMFLACLLEVCMQLQYVCLSVCLSHVLFRFKEGLSALGLYKALQLYPALLSPVLCHVEKQLTAEVLENLFWPDLSPSGSNSRAKEGRTLGFWADYLLDCQGLQKESAK